LKAFPHGARFVLEPVPFLVLVTLREYPPFCHQDRIETAPLVPTGRFWQIGGAEFLKVPQ
jgi:hypothetical protein